MSAIVPTVTVVGKGDQASIRYVWTPVTEADTCSPISVPEFSDKSFQVFGTFGGATAALHGSNDGGTTYTALHDPGGTAIGLTAAGIRAALENTEFIKPVTSGGSSQSLSIAMLVRQSNPKRT